MLRQVAVRTLSPSARSLARPSVSRQLHASAAFRAIDPKKDSGPSRDLSEGHTTNKSHGLDVQNQAANEASKEKKQSGGSGEAEPFDTARQGGMGAEKKTGGEGKGSLKDHRGGQPGGGGSMGGKESAAGGSVGESLKNATGMGKGKRSLHTSARMWKDPMSTPKSPRKPVEKSLHGDQNAHLKHKDAKEGDKGKGNAAEDPHLPSKNKPAASKGAKGARHFSTSVRVGAKKVDANYVKAHEPKEKADGFNAPSEALPAHLKSAYDETVTKQSPDSLKASSQAGYSSTAQDPPNEALRAAAKDGSLPDKNPQPHAKAGKQGNKEAWKQRGV